MKQTMRNSLLAKIVAIMLPTFAFADIPPSYPGGKWPANHCTIFDLSAVPDYVLLVSPYLRTRGPEGDEGNTLTFNLYRGTCVPTGYGVATMKLAEWTTLSNGKAEYTFTKLPSFEKFSYPQVLVADADAASKSISHAYKASVVEGEFLVFNKKTN